MYCAIDLSKYIVTKCADEGCPISNLQLQKILYYIQKIFVRRGCQAFPDYIEAWQFGPVVPNVYYHFCGFGAMPITTKYDSITIEPNDQEVIDDIVTAKRSLDPWEMVEETHKPNGAWDRVYRNGEGNHDVIPIQYIREEQ